MRISIAPNPWFWPREVTLAFYRDVASWPVDVVYVGETICSKRRELKSSDWLAIAEQLAAAGKEVVLSALALVESESEIGAMSRLIENPKFIVEANDLSAVQLCRQAGRPFVAGPSLNIYNATTLRLLQEDGLVRWVPGTEQGRALIGDLLSVLERDGGCRPELEVLAWGQPALAWSARCFTARALDTAKDDCGFGCIDFPDGLPLATRDGEPFLRINGVQIMGHETIDLGPELDDFRALGVDIVRISPQVKGLITVVERFRAALDTGGVSVRVGAPSGYWTGTTGAARLAGA